MNILIKFMKILNICLFLFIFLFFTGKSLSAYYGPFYSGYSFNQPYSYGYDSWSQPSYSYGYNFNQPYAYGYNSWNQPYSYGYNWNQPYSYGYNGWNQYSPYEYIYGNQLPLPPLEIDSSPVLHFLRDPWSYYLSSLGGIAPYYHPLYSD